MNAFLITNILMSLLNVGLCALFRNSYPKEINNVIGYRTKRSMKSQEAWAFANRYASDLMFKAAVALLVVQLPLHFLLKPEAALVTFVAIWITSLFMTILITERALRRQGF